MGPTNGVSVAIQPVFQFPQPNMRWVDSIPKIRSATKQWMCWLRVGLAPTLVLRMEPTHPLFGCSSDFGDGVNPSHVWLRELEIWVG